MANYIATIRTNYFSVTDEAKFRVLLGSVISEDTIHIFQEPKQDGSVSFAFGCHGTIDGIAESTDEYEEGNMSLFLGALQELLCDGDAIILTEIGSEQLGYVGGTSTVITKGQIQSISIPAQAVELARNMSGNMDYQTRLEY